MLRELCGELEQGNLPGRLEQHLAAFTHLPGRAMEARADNVQQLVEHQIIDLARRIEMQSN